MKKHRGLTLLELLITLIIAAVIATVAFPNMRIVILSNRAATQANEMTTAINYARSEALKRGGIVAICPSADGETCDEDTGDFSQGWAVVVEGTGEVLRWWNPLPENTVMTLNAGDRIRLAGNGGLARAADGSAPTPQVIRSVISGCVGYLGRQLRIAVTGNVESEAIACS